MRKQLGGILAMLRRLTSGRPKRVMLDERGERVLRQAQAEGCSVFRSTRQGPEAIVVERSGEGSTFLWSNEDVVAYGRKQNWI